MDDIEVEPVDEIDEGDVDVEVDTGATTPAAADAPRYVLYGGKGGVGKTTMAAATALASAADGTRTLVVSTDPAHSLSDTFGVDVPARPGRIGGDRPLWGVEIDPDAAVEDAAGAGAGPLSGMEDLLGEGPMEALFGGAMPGADEAAAMQQLLTVMDDERFERVVIDTAPTGHTLRLLELPEVMDTMIGRIVSMRDRFQGMMGSVSGLFADDDADPEAGVDDLRTLADRIERLRTALQDPGLTDFRVVTLPEEMSVLESERLVERLEGYSIPAGTVIVNKVMEDLADVTGATSGVIVSPDLDDCEFCRRRWSVQQDALSRAQEVFVGREVKRVPLLADEVRGEDALRVVAACLAT